jgi:plastocyanin
MKKIYFVLALLFSFSASTFAQTLHTVNSGSYYYTPSNFTINVGDTVTWLNDGGLHNVNFDVSVITGNSFGNPESFASSPTTGPVLYTHVFTIPGSYSYDCSVGAHAQNGMVGSLTVNGPPSNTVYDIVSNSTDHTTLK